MSYWIYAADSKTIIGDAFSGLYKKVKNMKPLKTSLLILWASLGALALPGCSSVGISGDLVSDIVTDVQAGAVVAQDAYTALQAASQAMNGHGLSVKNAIAYAGAEASSANSSGLAMALSTVVNDVSSQLAKGGTPATATATIAQAQAAVANTTPVPATTHAIWTPSRPVPGSVEEVA